MLNMTYPITISPPDHKLQLFLTVWLPVVPVVSPAGCPFDLVTSGALLVVPGLRSKR